MKFKDQEHEQYYQDFIGRAKRTDIYHRSLFYTLAANEDTRRNVGKLFNFDDDCIIPEGLLDGFQTGGSLRVTRMAFNLFTDDTTNGIWNDELQRYGDGADDYSPTNLFDCCDAPYFWEALQIRFPYLTDLQKMI